MEKKEQKSKVELLVAIRIDCAPGRLRPDTYLEGALSILDCKEMKDKLETTSRLFGAWGWCFKIEKDSDVDIDELLKRFRQYFERLNFDNKIRGAEWGIVENKKELEGRKLCNEDLLEISKEDKTVIRYLNTIGLVKFEDRKTEIDFLFSHKE